MGDIIRSYKIVNMFANLLASNPLCWRVGTGMNNSDIGDSGERKSIHMDK